jgi:hypothetical protein
LDHDFRRLPAQADDCDNFMSAFMFGFVPYQDGEFLREGVVVPLNAAPVQEDCLDDITQVCSICETLGKDCLVVDLSDPEHDFPVVQVIVPGYSDVLPFHPADSCALLKKWNRTDVLESYQKPNQ